MEDPTAPRLTSLREQNLRQLLEWVNDARRRLYGKASERERIEGTLRACQKYFTRQIALLSVPSPQPEWLLIETAPKDGTPVLLFNAKWLVNALTGAWRDREWLLYGVGRTNAWCPEPTHWMPLPSAPTEAP